MKQCSYRRRIPTRILNLPAKHLKTCKLNIRRNSENTPIKYQTRLSSLRKIQGLSQEKLAENAGISRSLLSVIEAPNIAHCFSMEVFYNIADALEISPAELLNASIFPDNIINKNKE
ncbi:MAG: helix-turn-helix transcriptional regulator [Oscillospiraceae bacterium]|nr:helix-turn-helix transcriptional regulator [Oscillospiraceae bacterium]